MNEQQTILRGKEAQAVLDSEAFKLALESMRAQVREQWLSCPIRDREGQMLLLQLAKLTDKFEGIFVGMVQTGNFAQRKIELDGLRDEPRARQFFRKVIG